MHNIFKKLFSLKAFTPPSDVELTLKEKFPEIINVDWSKSGDNYEAIFYKDQLEYIAILDGKGVLIEYKMLLSEGMLPEQIKTSLLQKGEIMNVVMINKGNSILYEIIIRNEELSRFLFLLNETGHILDEKQL